VNNKLPNNWIIKPLGEVVTTLKGKKPKNSGPPSDERTIPYINIKAFESGQPTEFAEPGGYSNCDRDNVLIVWDGARSGLIGRGVSGYIGSTLARVDSEIADKGYLFYFLQSQYKHINTQTKGVGIPHVDPSIFKAIPFPIAPLDQQKRIVAEIEKQFSRLDEAVANLKRVRANLKRYKAAVLKAAVEGKLTEEWRKQNPDIEPASKLLERILAERRKKWEEAELAKMEANGKVPKDDTWKKKYKVVPKITIGEVGQLPDLPESWVYVRLGEFIEEPKYGTSKKCDYQMKGIGVLRIPNVVNGFVDSSDLKFAEFDEKECQVYDLAEGDILTIRSNGSISLVGKCALIKKKDEQYLYAGYLIRLRPIETAVYSKYLINCLSSLLLRKQIEFKAKSTSGVNNINSGELQSLIVPICSKEEQAVILNEVESRLTIMVGIEGLLDINLHRSESLRQSILSKAFSGQLIEPKALGEE